MKTNFLRSSALGALVLTALSILFDFAIGRSLNPSLIGWMLLSNTLVSVILGLTIKNNILFGRRLALSVFLIYFLIGHFSLLIEAYIFDVTERQQTLMIILQGFMITLISSPILVLLFGKWKGQERKLDFAPRSGLSWVWRILVGDILYVFLYLLAGFILYAVYPQLMDFYGDKVPPFSVMINTQFFRAAIFIGVAVLLSRTIELSLFHRALLVGSFFSIVGGLAPLMVPDNEIMPAYIRLGHAFEVGISNFLLGIALTYLLGQKILAKNLREPLRSKQENELNLI